MNATPQSWPHCLSHTHQTRLKSLPRAFFLWREGGKRRLPSFLTWTVGWALAWDLTKSGGEQGSRKKQSAAQLSSLPYIGLFTHFVKGEKKGLGGEGGKPLWFQQHVTVVALFEGDEMCSNAEPSLSRPVSSFFFFQVVPSSRNNLLSLLIYSLSLLSLISVPNRSPIQF